MPKSLEEVKRMKKKLRLNTGKDKKTQIIDTKSSKFHRAEYSRTMKNLHLLRSGLEMKILKAQQAINQYEHK